MPFRRVHTVGRKALALGGIGRSLHIPLVTDRYLTGIGPGTDVGRTAAGPPIPTTDLATHFRADLGVTKDGSNFVSAWVDQVGSRDLAEATNKPLWVASGVNGHPVIRGDGSNDLLSESDGAIDVPYHIFCVFNQVTWIEEGTLWGSNAASGSSVSGKSGSTTPNIEFRSGGAGAAISATLGTFFLGIVLGKSGAAANFLSLNDGTPAAGVGTTVSITTGIRLFDDGGGPTPGNFEIAEWAYYSAEQTGSALVDVKNYFNSKYSLY
jgi:hypothetical protein